MKAGILGVGKYIPEKIVTNADLEKILDTNDEWIRTRTGIEERRIADNDTNTSHMAVQAAQEALERSNVDAADIDLILVATVTPDYSFPSVACLVQAKLGCTKAAAMDISAACTGFIYGLSTAAAFIESGQYKNVIVVGADKLSKIVNWEDRNTAVLFGDGAGAFVLGAVEDGSGILACDLGSDGNGAMHLYHDDYIQMNGREVFKLAVRQMGESCERVMEETGTKKEDVQRVIPHQANIRIMESIRDRMRIEDEKMTKTIHKYGNTSSASIPMAFCKEWEEGNIKKGDIIVMAGFGGGFTWGACLVKL